jgi:AraC-like DNA-binding protein
MAKVSSVTFHYILKSLEKNTNISIDEMLDYVDLEKEVLSSHEVQIDSTKLSSIFMYCMKKSEDYTLALKIGSSVTYHSLGILAYLMLNTNNLGQMIEKFDYYQKLISGFIKFHLYKDDEYYKIAIYINENPMIPVPNFHAEVHLSAILAILSQILDEKLIPDKTHFGVGGLSNRDEYKKVFGENIYLNKDENAIFFSTKKLNKKVNNSNPMMLEYFEVQANKILEDMQVKSLYAKVKKEILKSIGEKDITIEFIAKKLDISTRTLQYHLKDENKKFRDALLSVRMQLATHYIKNTKMDFSSIAILLGYSEASSFFRAYKKYYNKTPKEYKAKD